MSNDIRSILERLSLLEGATTPVTVKHGLNKQQQNVPQLPALFKPKSASPVLTAKKDPKHPMDGYMVGDSVEPKKNALEETMSEIEEDMLAKVKRDLTHYLDKLEQKVRVDRDLKDKAVDAVGRGEAEESIEENDYDLTNPEFDHDIEDKLDTQAVAAQEPVSTVAMEDGSVLEIHGDDDCGYEVRHGGRSLPTRFPKLDHANMAVKLFQKRRQGQATQDLSQDYIEEK